MLLAVGLQLGFASAFFADAANTNHIRDSLSAHRVSATARTDGCFVVVTGRTTGVGIEVCRVSYRYDGKKFSAVIPSGETRVF